MKRRSIGKDSKGSAIFQLIQCKDYSFPNFCHQFSGEEEELFSEFFERRSHLLFINEDKPSNNWGSLLELSMAFLLLVGLAY